MAKNNGDSEIRKTTGAPLFEFDFDFVEQQAALGLSYEQLAIACGFDLKTFNKRREISPDLQEAVDRGYRAKDINDVINALYQKALKGDALAQIFWLKNRSDKND